MTKILVADSHPIVRRGLAAVLRQQRWEVCGEASTGREAISLAQELKPDIVVIELMMPELSGLEATRHIRAVSGMTQVLVFTARHTETLVCDVLAAGARGYLLKTEGEEQIVVAVKALLEHRT